MNRSGEWVRVAFRDEEALLFQSVTATPIYDELRAGREAPSPRRSRAWRAALADGRPVGNVVRALSTRPGLGGRHRKPLDDAAHGDLARMETSRR
jgi:hypothetical protein